MFKKQFYVNNFYIIFNIVQFTVEKTQNGDIYRTVWSILKVNKKIGFLRITVPDPLMRLALDLDYNRIQRLVNWRESI